MARLPDDGLVAEASQDLLERRADEAAELLATAFARDVHGAQDNVLATLRPELLDEPGLQTLQYDAALAFSRYPYVESLFGWRNPRADELVVLTRADRHPTWMSQAPENRRAYPVEVWRRVMLPPAVMSTLTRTTAGPLIVTQARLDDGMYQIVARQVSTAELQPPVAVFGFTVNIDWLRQHYFPDLARQVAQIAGG
jgi:hypothetical protein